ncbi:MAG: hypothetical protein A2135_06695 [Actinobacteria bacterium RBG_16_67_15]|nr:MAG: hypothetical protein A2135_06695 [Actinobacteria bacterium RBG_16_67_15]
MDTRARLSTLWIVVMFNMAFADILSFFLDWSTGTIPETVATRGLMLVAAALIEISIAMIFLSRALAYRTSRWANMIAGVITAVWVVGGGVTYPHYIFLATVEVFCLSAIIWIAWKWSEPIGQSPQVAASK